MFRIVFRSRFAKALSKLDKKAQYRIIDQIESLVEDPFHHPGARRIIGVTQKAFRLRIGRWRVLYFVITKNEIIEVIDLFMRSGNDDYRKRLK